MKLLLLAMLAVSLGAETQSKEERRLVDKWQHKKRVEEDAQEKLISYCKSVDKVPGIRQPSGIVGCVIPQAPVPQPKPEAAPAPKTAEKPKE